MNFKLMIRSFIFILTFLFFLSSCKNKKPSSEIHYEESSLIDSSSGDEESISSKTQETSFNSDLSELNIIKTVIESRWNFDVFTELMDLKDPIYFNRYYNFNENNVSIKRGEIITNQSVVKLSGNIENLILLKPNLSLDQVKKSLGKPTFENKDIDLSGYVFTDAYIFFVGETNIEEISIYKNYAPNNSGSIVTFIKSLEIIHSFETLSEHLNALDITWKDNYDINYDYGNKYSSRYGLRKRTCFSEGINFEFKNDTPPVYELSIYSNFSEYENFKTSYGSRENVKFIDDDLVFIKEQERINTKELEKTMYTMGVVSPNSKYCVMENNDGKECGLWGIFVIDFKKPKNNKEIYIDNILNSDIYWINDRYFVYQPLFLGVKVYDLMLNKTIEIYPGLGKQGTIKIISTNNNEIKLKVDYYNDDTQKVLEISIPYSVKSDEKITFSS